MKNEKISLRKQPLPIMIQQISQGDRQLKALKSQLNQLYQRAIIKVQELNGISSKLRYQGLRSQKLKKQMMEIDEKMHEFEAKQVEQLFQKYRDSKSPLFYNQNGLSPFQLMKIGQSKYEGIGQNMICMVCFGDFSKGNKIMRLPCTHLLHKQCGIQHLLYCNQCPACFQDLK